MCIFFDSPILTLNFVTGFVRNIGTKNRMLKLEESLRTVIRYLPLVRDSAIGGHMTRRLHLGHCAVVRLGNL